MLGEVHVFPCFCNGFDQPLHFCDAVEGGVGFYVSGKQLPDGVCVEVSEILRDVTSALIIQASLQADQNSAGFAEAFTNLVFVVVLLMDFSTS